MKSQETEYIGRVGRAAGANAPVLPIAERAEDGSWRPLADAKARFSPSGTVELLSALAFRIREGDLIAFHPAAAITYRAANSSRAVGIRRLARFLGGVGDADAEHGRRLLVEAGLDDAEAGEWVIRVGPGAVARVALALGGDGRWRAEPQPKLGLRRFDPALVVDGRLLSEPGAFFDFEAAERTAEVADWSRDGDFLISAARALPHGGEEMRALLELVERHVDGLTGRVSAADGHDPGIAAELVRAGALADRLRQDAVALAAFVEVLKADPVLRDLLDSEAAAKAAAEVPALAAAARADVKREMADVRAAAAQEVRATVAAMEVEELAGMEERRARRAAEIEAQLKRSREYGVAEIEAVFAARQAELTAEARKLDDLLRAATAEVERLDARRADLEGSVAAAVERETALLERVESLARTEQALAARPAVALRPTPGFREDGRERRLELSEVGEIAAKTRLLTAEGVDAVVRMALLSAAGELSVLVGDGAKDFLDVAALILAGGRTAMLTGDPTTITFEDLWSRPGGNGPTVLSDAAEAASKGLAIVAAVAGAEASGARYWFPPLTEAFRAGALPAALILCVTVEDVNAPEAEHLLRHPFRIDVTGLVDDKTAALAPVVFDLFAREPAALGTVSLAVDPAATAAALSGLGGGLGLGAARRLARLHSAAQLAYGDAGSVAVAAFREALSPRQQPSASASRLSHLTQRASNA